MWLMAAPILSSRDHACRVVSSFYGKSMFALNPFQIKELVTSLKTNQYSVENIYVFSVYTLI